MWDGVKNLGREIGQGIGNIGKGLGKAVQEVGQKARGSYQMGNLKGTFDRINKDIASALQYAQQASSQAVNPQKKQQIADMVQQLSNMQMMGQQVYQIVEETAATEAAEAPAGAPEAPAAGAPAAPAVGNNVDGLNAEQLVQLITNSTDPSYLDLPSNDVAGMKAKLESMPEDQLRQLAKEVNASKKNLWVRIA